MCTIELMFVEDIYVSDNILLRIVCSLLFEFESLIFKQC